MTTHRYVGEQRDNIGWVWLVCSCGHQELRRANEDPRITIDRHRLHVGRSQRRRTWR